MDHSIRQGEKAWHEDLFRRESAADATVPPRIRERYLNPRRRPLFDRETMFRLAGDVRGKRILVFGCGNDNSTILLALLGAQVYAFDLSEEAIRYQVRAARANGVADRLHPLVCAAEELPFDRGHFDLIFGSAILHHVPDHLPSVARELARILKHNGVALFAEPVVRSRALKWLLDRLPGHQEISPGERQLNDADLAHFSRHFQLELYRFCFLSRLDRFVLKGPLETASWAARAAVYFFHGFDYLFLNTPLTARLAGVLVMKGTRKSDAVEPLAAAASQNRPARLPETIAR
jgi:SAM-dependent methyltransferase